MLGCFKLRLTPCFSSTLRKSKFHCKAENLEPHGPTSDGNTNNGQKKLNKKKVLVVGSGWAGLGAAHHLTKQGFDVTVLEGGLDTGFSAVPYTPDEVGIQGTTETRYSFSCRWQKTIEKLKKDVNLYEWAKPIECAVEALIGQSGFWYPYRNIFSLVDELGLKPFTSWIRSAHYSEEGMEVEFPVFQEEPQLPAPLGALAHTRFTRLPPLDRLTSIPLMAAAVDFDNTDTAWRRYDPITARELLRQFGCSEKLYRDVIDPLLEVRLFAPAEQCSAAATLAVLYYYVIAHQKDLDLVLCRGTVRKKIFEPWMDLMRSEGCEFRKGRQVTDFFFSEETGCISDVVCGNDRVKADAVILAVSISSLQEIVKKSSALCAREEFLKVLNLAGIDAVSVKLFLDTKVTIRKACNACSGFDGSFAWTFFDLNAIYDEHENDPATILQADFYHANEILPLSDEQIVSKVTSYLTKCIEDFENAKVTDKEIRRFPRSLTHFFPGSYKYMMRASTSFPNLFMAGDWIINRHGSWSQEKSYVTGLEAANMVVDFLQEGSFAKIIPVEEDEPHIQTLRSLNRNVNEIRSQLPWSSYFLQ